MSILPNDSSISTIQETTTTASVTAANNTDLPIFKEYAWDFVNDDFLLQDGDFIILEKNEALKVWIYKALKTPRFRYLAYSFYYGNEFETIIGQSYNTETMKAKLKALVEECLLVNVYIKSINTDDLTLTEGELTGVLTITTVYGQMEVSLNDIL